MMWYDTGPWTLTAKNGDTRKKCGRGVKGWFCLAAIFAKLVTYIFTVKFQYSTLDYLFSTYRKNNSCSQNKI